MHLADAFIQSDLQLHSGYTFSLVCSLGIEPTTFCAADAMLYHWATQEPEGSSMMTGSDIILEGKQYKY